MARRVGSPREERKEPFTVLILQQHQFIINTGQDSTEAQVTEHKNGIKHFMPHGGFKTSVNCCI